MLGSTTLTALFHMRSMAALMAGARRSMRLRAHIGEGDVSHPLRAPNLPLRKAATRVVVQVTLQAQLPVGAPVG